MERNKQNRELQATKAAIHDYPDLTSYLLSTTERLTIYDLRFTIYAADGALSRAWLVI